MQNFDHYGLSLQLGAFHFIPLLDYVYTYDVFSELLGSHMI